MSIPGAKMLDMLALERSARKLMAAVAITAAVVGLGFNAGLLSMAPQYDRQSWYLVSEHAGFIVESVVADEAACRKREELPAVCHSGGSMQAGVKVGQP